MDVDDRFRIGSVSKTFVAAAVLLLVDDGRLSLDDHLADWVPGFPRDPTVAQLLNHTSGLGEYLFDDAIQSDRSRSWTEDELLDVARAAPPTDEVGARFRYANTNYLLAGVIVSAASEMHWSEFVQMRILAPLGLEDTFVAGFQPVVGGRADGYDTNGAEPVEISSSFDQTIATSAGCLVSDVDDLLRWTHALYGGELLSEEALEAMHHLHRVPHAHDGGVYEGSFVGLANFIGTDDTFGEIYGHAGGTPGFSANMRYLERDGSTIVLLVNADLSSGAEARLRAELWAALLL